MGFYIQTDGAKHKADYIIAEHGATEIPALQAPIALENGLGVIVVVENAAFDAAAFAYSQEELGVFRDLRDTRPKRFLTMPYVLAAKLSGYRPRKP